MEKVFKGYDTAGNPIFERPNLLECGCNSTAGCSKCNSYHPFWEEDIKMAEEGMGEYNKILKAIDKE